jgi:hypothetical protein
MAQCLEMTWIDEKSSSSNSEKHSELLRQNLIDTPNISSIEKTAGFSKAC